MYVPDFMKLENARKDELLYIIKRTKNFLRRLKREMEDFSYRYKDEVSPSKLTIYHCEKSFLRQAVLKHLTLGGNYEMDRTEKKDYEFTESIHDIVKITHETSGFFTPSEITVVDLNNNGYKILKGERDYLCEFITENSREDFLLEFEDLHVGEWKKYYSSNVLDGTQWNLTIEYANGSKREFGGSSAYPYNYCELANLLHFDFDIHD